jgi:hypothetical protein
MKRLIEIQNLKGTHELARGYTPQDTLILTLFGVSATFISLLIFTLYLNSEQILMLYETADWFWGMSFTILVWSLDSWMQVSRHEISKDPVLYFATRPRSYVYVGAMLVFLLLAI